jgi:hypothetical protein
MFAGELDLSSGLDEVLIVRKEGKFLDKWKLAPAPVSTVQRRVFVSITHLERMYQNEMQRDHPDLTNAVFFFDADRRWVFPPNGLSSTFVSSIRPGQTTLRKTMVGAAASRSAQSFDARYMKFDEDFRALLHAKEEAGTVVVVRLNSCRALPFFILRF